MRNIELKARLRSPETVATLCNAIDATPAGDLKQRDTYFNCTNGLMKLREIEPGDDYLVHYLRPNVADTKACDYSMAPVDALTLKPLLSDALGVRAVVEKVRTLWFWENVRIHIDSVKDLGDFIEFEAVLSEEFDEADGFNKLGFLRKTFGIENDDLCDVSYAEMMLARLEAG